MKYLEIFNSLQPDGVNETLGLKCDNCLPSCSEEVRECNLSCVCKFLNILLIFSNYIVIQCPSDYFNQIWKRNFENSEEVSNAYAYIKKQEFEMKFFFSYGAGVDLMEKVQLRVFFKDISCIKYRRDVVMTWDTMLGLYIHAYLRFYNIWSHLVYTHSFTGWNLWSMLGRFCYQFNRVSIPFHI